MYRVLKHSQVSFNHAEPYYIAQDLPQVVEVETNDENDIEIVADHSAELEAVRMQKDKEIKIKHDKILNEAKQKAEEIIKNAEAEGDRIARAKEKDGFEKGIKRANEVREQQTKEIEDLKLQLAEDFERKVFEFKNNILDLALVLVKKVIHTECEKNDYIILNVLDNVVNQYRDEKNLTVEVSKNNFDKLTAAGVKTEYKVKSNENFNDTDIQVTVDNGIIDASIDVQVENLKQAILKESLCYEIS